MDLYNVKTRQKERIDDPVALQQALLDGTHSFEAGTEVVAYAPDTGKPELIPSENVGKAVGFGYKVETPTQRTVREYVDQNEGLKGAVKVGLGQFADEALMGIPELIFNKTADPLEVAKKEALKEAHKTANTLGGLGGFGASTVLGGPLFKSASKAGEAVAANVAERLAVTTGEEVGKRTLNAVAKDIVKQMAAKGAGGATEGLIVSSPLALTEAALGDPDDAAETLLAGVGIGTVFGAASGLGKELTSMGKRAFASEAGEQTLKQGMKEGLEKSGYEKAVEVLNPTLSQQERLAVTNDLAEVGKDLFEQGILDGLPDKQTIYQRLVTTTEKTGKRVGELLQKADEQGGLDALIASDDVARQIRETVGQRFGEKIAYKPALEKLETQLKGLEDARATWTLAEANAQKSAFQDIVRNWGLEDQVHKNFTKEISRGLNNAIESKFQAISPELAVEFSAAKRLHSNLEAAEQIAKKSAAREARNNDFGLTSFVTAAAGAGIAGVPGAIAGLFGREFLRRYGDQVAAKAMLKTSGLLFAEKAMKKTADKLDEIPSLLDRMASSAKPKLGRSTGALALVRMLSSDNADAETASMDRSQRSKTLDDFSDKSAVWASNPAAATEQLARLSMPITKGGAPRIGEAFNMKTSQALNYLHAVMPKPPRPRSPFAPKVKFRPSDSELSAFEDKAQVVADPLSVLSELEHGTLTRHHVEALKSVYPGILRMIQTKVQDAVVNGVKPMAYSQRLKLSLLLDVPLDTSTTPEAVAYYQEAHIASQQAEQQQAQSGFQASVNVADQTMSPADRVTNRRG